ncbi:Glutamyl-tRNA(Gln) amidotransferase subunit A [Pseudocercospora fuligena]|uniref:Glutamyl-tRNA(Gln) amidotransferase subunit A n=1 Tax=Pseudocercospora fuligena TaxID=685502 RepID=A0A8H6RR31_9PEZI|nr:Glutamyl-tRNA(Gln) amidotransferase subunit A [Pseudocercospora fuligena]
MSINLVEASIADLQHALSSGSITSVELVTKYLQRIATYDARGPCLNSIPILNEDVFDQAAASDARRAAGKLLGPLDGIPYTLKDSMKYKGMTCSSGSPALEYVVANEDSFVAEQLRKAGAVCIGRTNTPPMMASGMHRGVHGRAESPYNLEYLTAAFSSGSSNGSGTSTAASFAAFGLGSETVSSGRSPASNNALVAYTPSRTVISPRGCWPLYPTCDVLVPHTRTVEDMLAILDPLTTVDWTKDGDFWREQSYVEIPHVERPSGFNNVKVSARGSLKGKKVAAPLMYIGGHDPKAKPTVVSQGVIDLWKRAKQDLEALGATVVETDFPLVTNYEDDSVTGTTNNVVGFKPDWNSKERGELVAFLWDDFLKSNGDPHYPSLASVDGKNMFPRPDGYIPDRYMEHKNFMDYPRLVEIARNRPEGKAIWDIDGIAQALPALEAQRKRDLKNWMDRHGIDVVAFPAAGDVGRADVDTNDESARHALQNGVKYSNGNRAIRHMGVPTVSVTMGILEHAKMPVNLTFAGKHGQDVDLLRYAYDFEQQSKRRITPPVTPALESDRIALKTVPQPGSADEELSLEIASAQRVGETEIEVTGSVSNGATIEVFVDGKMLPNSDVTVSDGQWSAKSAFVPFEPPKALYGGVGKVVGNVVIVVLARDGGTAIGKLIFVGQKASINQK